MIIGRLCALEYASATIGEASVLMTVKVVSSVFWSWLWKVRARADWHEKPELVSNVLLVWMLESLPECCAWT